MYDMFAFKKLKKHFISDWLNACMILQINHPLCNNFRSTRKPPPPRSDKPAQRGKQPTFEEVYNQTSPTNCTVYCGGFTNGISEELMQKTFSPYGVIQDIRVFKDKGYAFIRFATKESATHAIENVHNTEINGQVALFLKVDFCDDEVKKYKVAKNWRLLF